MAMAARSGASDGPRRKAQSPRPGPDAARSPDARTLEISRSAELLRVHRARPRRSHPVLYRLAERAQHHGAGRSHAPSVGTLSAAPVPLPQGQRGAAELPQPTRAASALARLVPVDEAPESHPAQSGFRDRVAATRPRPAEKHLLGRRGRAHYDAA